MTTPKVLNLINLIQQQTGVKFIFTKELNKWQWSLRGLLMSELYDSPEEAIVGCIKFFASFYDEVHYLSERLGQYGNG